MEAPFRSPWPAFSAGSSPQGVTSGAPAPAAADPSEPSGDAIREEIAWRWDAQRGLDDAVAAVRGGEADRAIATAESLRNSSVLAGMLALMMGSRNPAMLRHCPGKVTHE